MKKIYLSLIILLILAISFATTTSQQIQAEQPTLELEKKVLDIGVEAPFNLTIDTLPTGLSGYNITITVEDPSIAEIVAVEFPAWATLTDNSTMPASSVWIKAVDLEEQVQPNATNVILATLMIKVKGEGVSDLLISITKLDDDEGNPITPIIVNGSVIADKTPPTTTVTANVPTQTVAPNWIMADWTNQKVILSFHRSDAGIGVDYTKLSLAEASEVGTLSVTITNNSWTWNATLSKGAEITVPYNETFGDTFNVTIDIAEGTKVNATLQYYSVDKNGNVEDTKYVTVRIDKAPPVIIFIPPTPADGSLNCTGYITIEIQSDKPLEWAKIDYGIEYINGTEYWAHDVLMDKLDTEGTEWSYNITINDDARLRYNVWCEDKIGNTNSTGYRTVTASVAPPIVNIMAPEEAVVGATVDITITINDTALHKYELYENGVKIGEKVYELDEALNLLSVSIHLEVTRSAPDNVTYTIKAFDFCGNENSTSKTIRFVSVGFFSPYPEPDSYVNNSMTEISVKFAQVTNIRMFVDGVEVSYTMEENKVKYIPTEPLSEGEHCAFVNGTYNGKEYNISWCFTVDTIKPVIEYEVFDTDDDGFPEIDEQVKIWYNVTDVNFFRVKILVNNEPVTTLTEPEGWYSFTPTVIGDYKLVAYDKANNTDVKEFHIYNNYLVYAIRSEPKEKFTVNLTKLATLDLMNRSEVNVIVYGGEEISIPLNKVERTIIPGTKAKYTVYPDYRANGTITNFYQTCVVYEKGSLLDVYMWTKTHAKGMIILVKLNDSKAEDKIAEFARTFSLKGLIKIDELPEFIEGDVYFFGKEGCGRAIYDRAAEKFTGAETWGHITITEDLDDMLNESEYPHNIIDFSQGIRLTDIPGYVSGAAVTMADATGLSSLEPGTYLLLAIGKDGDVIALNAMMPIVVINGTREQIESELALPKSLPRGESFEVHFPNFVNRTAVLMLKNVIYNASVLINASEEWVRIWRVNITYDNKPLRELIYYKEGEPKHTKIWIPIGMGRGAYKKSNVLTIDTDDLEIGSYLLCIFAQEVGGRLYYAGVVEMNLTAVYAVNITSTPLKITVEKNETAEFVLTVKNVGNVNDSYFLSVEAPEELSYTLSKTEFFLPKKASTDVTLRVWGVVPGSYIVKVTVTSMNYSNVKATVSVIVNVIKAVDIDSDVTLRPVGVGEKALFNLTVTNTGLYTHDYNITCWVRPGAVIFLNGVNTTTYTIPNLGKGDSKTLKLEVLAQVNETFTVYIKANTTTKGNVEDYDNLTIIVSALAYYGVSVTPEVTYRNAERGEVVSFNLTVRNEGNVPDTYTIEVLKPPEVGYSLSATEVTIPNGSSSVVRLDVWSNELGTYDISIITKSKSDPSISHETMLTFEVIGAVELSVDTELNSTMITKAGERAEVTFNLTVTNTGKYKHDYTLVCYNSSEVIVKLDGVPVNTTTKANVPKGGSVSITLALNVTEGEYSVLVSAVTTTRGGVTEYDNVTVTAAVSMLRIYGVRLSVDKVMERIKPGQIAVYNITVMNIGNVKDNFSLMVINPKADVASLNKTYLSLGPGKSEVVVLNVSDPEPGEYVVEVVATSEGDPSKFDSVSTTTFIESYGLILSVDTLHQTRKANESAIFTLSLLNIGNVMDNYTVTIESNCAYDLTGYDVYPIPGVGYNVTNVSAGEERILTFRLMSTVEGIYYANVTAKSQGDPSKVDFVNVTVEFKKEKVYNFELTVLPAMNFVEIYDNATFTVRIKNTGNAEDTYVLTTTEGVLENNTLTVMPGEVKTTTLTVYCTELRTVTITVTAQSTNNTSIVKSVTVYASVVPPVMLEPTPSSQTTYVCNKSKFMIRVTNTGVEPHTFDISVLSNIEYYRLSTERVYLEPYESVDIILTMHSSTVGTYYATITAYVSDRPEKSASTDVMVVYETVPIHGVTISVYPPFKQVEVGKSAFYRVTVSNVGNMDEEFSISITMNETLATLANATYMGMSLTELIPAGKSVSLLLNVTPTEIGSYDVVINASSLNASDVVKITTVAIGERNVTKVKSIVKDSALINSKIEKSRIEFSFIDPSYIAGSEIKRCVIRNSTVLRTTLSDVELYNATVQDGMIYNGTVFLYDVPYEIAREIGVYNIVVASESKKGTIAGRAHETIAVRSDLVGAEVDILNKGGYAGGSAKFDKSTIPPKGVEEPRMDIVVVRAGELTGIAKVGDYVNITLSDVVKRNLDKATVVIKYDPTKIPAGYSEDQLSLFRYNEVTGKWEELKNVVVDKVTKTVRGETREFSIFAVMAKVVAAPPPPAPPPPVPAPVGGGAVIIPPPLVAPAVVTFESLPIQFIAHVPKTIEIPAEYVEKTDVLKITALTEFSGIIKVAVSKVLKLPPEIPAPKYPVYSYVEIVFYSVVGEKITAKSGVVEFRVPKEWLRERGYDVTQVVLMKYEKEWKELKTEYVREDAKYYYFRAEVPTFSVFAIAARPPVVTPTPTPTPPPVTPTVPPVTPTPPITPTVTPTVPPPPPPPPPVWPIVAGVIIAAIVIGLVVYFVRKRRA